jgi:hypothetical protein
MQKARYGRRCKKHSTPSMDAPLAYFRKFFLKKNWNAIFIHQGFMLLRLRVELWGLVVPIVYQDQNRRGGSI